MANSEPNASQCQLCAVLCFPETGRGTFVDTPIAAAAQDGPQLNTLQAALKPHLQQVLVVVTQEV